MAYLYVVEVADFLFLLRQTGMTWSKLSAHLSKLEAADYVVIEKEFLGKNHTPLFDLPMRGGILLKNIGETSKGFSIICPPDRPIACLFDMRQATAAKPKAAISSRIEV